MGIRALYGGRYLPTTIALATTGVAAGAVTGAVGLGLASPKKIHEHPAAGKRSATHAHHRPAQPSPRMTFEFTHRPTPSPLKRSPSATPTPTRTTAPAAPVASSAPPTSAPPTAAPSPSDSSSANSTSAPQGQPTG